MNYILKLLLVTTMFLCHALLCLAQSESINIDVELSASIIENQPNQGRPRMPDAPTTITVRVCAKTLSWDAAYIIDSITLRDNDDKLVA